MSTMTFRMNDGQLSEIKPCKDILLDMKRSLPLSTAYIVDMPIIKEKIRNVNKGKALSVALPVLGMATGVAGSGVFWQVFMTYIFPWMMDIAKVWCAIKIAQAFYQEKRGGRDEGTGMSAFVAYGKWYLLFSLLPWGVELIDQLGTKMLSELRVGSMIN